MYEISRVFQNAVFYDRGKERAGNHAISTIVEKSGPATMARPHPPPNGDAIGTSLSLVASHGPGQGALKT